jgi:Dolichyl-phosphate-mannose-protein mannosyltransferase
MKVVSPYWPLIFLLAIVKFILPFTQQDSLYELQRDEYLYYQQGLHFAAGYLENPPLLSWLGLVSSWLGGSTFWIRFWPCLFGAATLVITCSIAAELGGKRFAQLIAGLGIISGAYIRVNYLFQPNFLDIFFWTLSIYFLVKFINSNNQQFLFGLAISVSLGCWAKYSMLFMAIAIVIGILLSHQRIILTKKKTWMAVVLGLLIITPNVFWQYRHNWPLLHHMEELRETQLKYIDRFDFLKEQLLMLMPVAAVWAAGLIWVLRTKEWRILAVIYFAILLQLVAGSGKGYYALGAYPMLLAAGGVAWEHLSARINWIRYALTVTVIGLNYLIMPLLLPIWKPDKLDAFYQKIGIKHKWEDLKEHPLPQDFADMLGWKELTQKTEKFFNSLPDSTKSGTIIYCRNYGQAGSLKFYGKDPFFKSKVISDNGSFLLWIPDRLWFKHLILVGRQMPDKDEEVFQHFEKTNIIDSVTNNYSRQSGNKIFFFENADDKAAEIARQGLNEMKNQFRR